MMPAIPLPPFKGAGVDEWARRAQKLLRQSGTPEESWKARLRNALDGVAEQWFEEWEGRQAASWSEVLQGLREQFRSRRQQEDARQRLRELRCPTTSETDLFEFAAAFAGLVEDAAIPPGEQTSQFIRGLPLGARGFVLGSRPPSPSSGCTAVRGCGGSAPSSPVNPGPSHARHHLCPR